MTLAAGTRLGPYEVLSALGAGGMGEVYRARDTTLNRDVALKILPTAFALDPDRLARFKREAQLLASLNHPNIGSIYGLEDSNGSRALVLELIEGPTLADRIAQAPISLDEALPIARQIAEALEAAHEQGIVHRDLKPANIKVRPDGTVKVLDFGLAKALEPLSADGADVTDSPTITSPAMTRMGVILGTAAYMSPEQAQGKAADRRADIWAFGVILHEMLTGRHMFRGETVSDTLAAVLLTEPAWDRIPVNVRPLLRRCLTKDPKRRLRDIGDAMALLESAPESVAAASAAASRRTILLWAAAASLAAVVAAAGWAMASRSAAPVDHLLLRLSVDLGPDAVAGGNIPGAFSPDEALLVFPAHGPDGKQRLATRLLARPETTLLAGTEDAADPFFSPDGQWIGFFAQGKMKKVSVSGGAVVTLCDAPDGRGASWGADDTIIATLNSGSATGLSRIPALGGKPQMITHPAETGEATHRWPQILPGNQAVLFMGSKTASNYDDASIQVLSLKTGQVKVVQRGGYFGRYLPGGYLVYIHQSTLFGVRFDLDTLEVRGTPVPLLDDVAGNTATAGGQFDFTRHGTFAYSTGKSSSGTWTLLWVDGAGRSQPLLAVPAIYYNPRLSPDGTRLAFSSNSAIKIYDWVRDTMTQLTFTTQTDTNLRPVWTPDGKHIVFVSQGTSDFSLQWIRADGSGGAQRLLSSGTELIPRSFSPDGSRLAFDQRSAETGLDILTLRLDLSDPEHPKPGQPEVFLRTPFAEQESVFSPDGHWIAYRSVESERSEVFVRPFSPAGRSDSGKWLVSAGGGKAPMWSRDGKELFYMGPDNRIMAAAYTANGDSFAPSKPHPWSNTQISGEVDLAPDGKRFVEARPRAESSDGPTGSVHVTFLLNFFDELHRRLP